MQYKNGINAFAYGKLCVAVFQQIIYVQLSIPLMYSFPAIRPGEGP